MVTSLNKKNGHPPCLLPENIQNSVIHPAFYRRTYKNSVTLPALYRKTYKIVSPSLPSLKGGNVKIFDFHINKEKLLMLRLLDSRKAEHLLR